MASSRQAKYAVKQAFSVLCPNDYGDSYLPNHSEDRTDVLVTKKNGEAVDSYNGYNLSMLTIPLSHFGQCNNHRYQAYVNGTEPVRYPAYNSDYGIAFTRGHAINFCVNYPMANNPPTPSNATNSVPFGGIPLVPDHFAENYNSWVVDRVKVAINIINPSNGAISFCVALRDTPITLGGLQGHMNQNYSFTGMTEDSSVDSGIIAPFGAYRFERYYDISAILGTNDPTVRSQRWDPTRAIPKKDVLGNTVVESLDIARKWRCTTDPTEMLFLDFTIGDQLNPVAHWSWHTELTYYVRAMEKREVTNNLFR